MHLWNVGMVVAAVSCAQVSWAQERLTEHTITRGPNGKPGTVNIESLAWLAGNWTGPGLGGQVDEVWSPPRDGEMIGMFRVVREGAPIFYEFFTLSEKDGGLTIRLKHFDRSLKGWEAQDEFVEFTFLHEREGAWYFDGLTYVRNGPDRYTAYVAIESDGKREELALEFQRESAPK